MRLTVNVIRILTGLLFIFSGLVKAIDPLGLAYKMQEFFEVWGQNESLKSLMNGLDKYALSFSIIMITLEVVVGVALLLGWQKKLTGWILLLLMLFFTFLTSFVLFTGKIRACGCFGDCLPITPFTSFMKERFSKNCIPLPHDEVMPLGFFDPFAFVVFIKISGCNRYAGNFFVAG